MTPNYSGIHRAGIVCKAGISLGLYPFRANKCSGRINLHEKPGKERRSVGVLEVLIIGIALSADAFAVTISDACAYKDESRARMMLLPIAFGLFQGLMPTLGYFLCGDHRNVCRCGYLAHLRNYWRQYDSRRNKRSSGK